MRIISAIVAFLLGLTLLGFGITQLNEENEETYTVETEGAEDAAFTLITDDLIDPEAGREEFTIESEGEYTIIEARTYDIEAWLGDLAHNRVTEFEESDDPESPSRILAEYVDGETDAPNPEGSDLWVSTDTVEGDTLYSWDIREESGDWALLIYADGEESAPATITATETHTVSNTAGIVMTIAGGLVLLLAMALFYWALGAPRRRRKKQDKADAAAAATATTVTSSEATVAAVDPTDTDQQTPATSEAESTQSHWSTPAVDSSDDDHVTEVFTPISEDFTEAEGAVAEEAEQDATGEFEAAADDFVASEDATAVQPAITDDKNDDDAVTAAESTEEDEPTVQEETEQPEEQDQDQTQKLSGWAKGLRDRLGRGGASAFAMLLAMTVAVISAVSLAGPVQADEEEDPEEAEETATEEPQEDEQDESPAAEDDEEAEADSEEDAETEDEATEEAEEEADDEEPAEVEAPEVEEIEGEAPEAEADEDPMPSEGYSVLLESQLDRIIADISDVVEAGDAEMDTELLTERVDGDALDFRELAYRNHELAETGMPAPIGTNVTAAVVTGEPEFPRQAFVAVEHPAMEEDLEEGETAYQILVIEQTDPRENYKLISVAEMPPGSVFPTLAAEHGGITPIESAEEPLEAIIGISEFMVDPGHDYADLTAESIYIESAHEYNEELISASEEDVEIEFSSQALNEEGITGLELPDGSILAAGSFESVMEMLPLEDGDTIWLEDELVEETAGTDWSTFPVEIITREQIVVHIPAPESEEGIELVAVASLFSDAFVDAPEGFEF